MRYVVASTRPHLLSALLSSMRAYCSWTYSITVCAQGFSKSDLNDLEGVWGKGMDLTVLATPHLLGPHSARILMLKHAPSDVYVSLDDDMEFLPRRTQHGAMCKLLSERPGVGFMSGNWVRSPRTVEGKVIRDRLVVQPIVYTGGGLAFRQDVADLILEAGDHPYLFDDVEWSLLAYRAGYVNCRWQGSLLIHRIVRADGRKVWTKQAPRQIPDPRYITTRPSKTDEDGEGNGWHIPSSSDLTDAATDEHHRNRTARLAP